MARSAARGAARPRRAKAATGGGAGREPSPDGLEALLGDTDIPALREQCSKNYFLFILAFWEIIEPETEFFPNWHIEYLADLLQAEAERIAEGKPKTGDLVVNIPPRSMKSYLVTIMFNAWCWTRWPWMKFITTSYNANLAKDHSMKTRRIITSPLYKKLWGSVYRLRDEQNEKFWYETDKGGMRKTAGTGGGITGQGGDFLICDDPLNPIDLTESALAEAVTWWGNVAYSRLNRQEVGVRLVIMQRLHEKDLVGHLVEQAKENSLRFPLRKYIIPADDSFDICPPSLAENYKDGLFWPERFTRGVLSDYKINLGGKGYAQQMGQTPAPAEGVIFKRDWFRRFKPEEAPKRFDEVIGSWDLSFKDSKTSSFVVGQIWGRLGMQAWLLDTLREKLSFVNTRAAIRDMRRRWPHCYKMLIEDKANGPAIIDDLQQEMGGLIAVAKPRGKTEQAEAASPVYEAGCVYIPIGRMGDDFIEEHLTFPGGRYNDQVDAAAQFIISEMKHPPIQKIGAIIRKAEFSEKPRTFRGLT